MAFLQLSHKLTNAGLTGALIVSFVNGVVGNQIHVALEAPQVLGQFLCILGPVI